MTHSADVAVSLVTLAEHGVLTPDERDNLLDHAWSGLGPEARIAFRRLVAHGNKLERIGTRR